MPARRLSRPRPHPVLDEEPADVGLDQGELHPYSPMGQIEQMGTALRSFKHGSATGRFPRWVSILGWLAVVSLLAPVVIGLVSVLVR
jgi:hypothetical protein